MLIKFFIEQHDWLSLEFFNKNFLGFKGRLKAKEMFKVGLQYEENTN